MRLHEITTPRGRGKGGSININTTAPDTLAALSALAPIRRSVTAQVNKQKQKAARDKSDNITFAYSVQIPRQAVVDWQQTHDKDAAFAVARNWLTARYPSELKDELQRDKRWQDIVIQIFDKAIQMLPYYGKTSDPNLRSVERPILAGVSAKENLEFVRKLVDLTDFYLEKYNLDRKGRRLPSKR